MFDRERDQINKLDLPGSKYSKVIENRWVDGDDLFEQIKAIILKYVDEEELKNILP